MGAKLSGMRLDGAAFMSPIDLGAAIWLKRGTGITIATGVSQWDDQSGNGRHFAQATTTRQPAYNSGTGVITFDGTSDYLRLGSSIPNSATGEIVFVVKFPAGAIVWSKDANTTIDADAYTFTRSGTKSRFNKDVTSSNETLSFGDIPATTWVIVGASNDGLFSNRNRLFLNGQEMTYSKQGITSWLGAATRMYIGAGQRNSGGAETTPINFGNFDIVDFAMFDGFALNPIQRSRLAAYYRNQYSDLLT